jgi:DNA adenine methylase
MRPTRRSPGLSTSTASRLPFADEAHDHARPFLKWAGGKSQLLSQFGLLYPDPGRIVRYIEPFVGGGAVFFHVRSVLGPRRVILADANDELINAWECIHKDVEGLIRRLGKHRKLHSQEHYYKVRAQEPGELSPIERAARIIYLNKTCFNGLYRVNRSGRFNVPMGNYVNPRIFDAANLRAASDALRGVRLKQAHFRETLSYARKGDFVYFDPPYVPLSETSQFTSYAASEGKAVFDEDDQIQLADLFTKLARRGCHVMLSNSDCEFVRRLYRRFWIYSVKARRSINCKADRRGGISEAVVLSYEATSMGARAMLVRD